MKKKKADIEKIFELLSKTIENPVTELEYINEYTLLVAIILSAQATDKSVNKATKELFKICNSPEDMVKMGIDGLKNYIKSIGLYNSKAKNIIEMSKILINDFDSKVPAHFDQLIDLPGVGRKTAKVFLNCAYHAPVIAVDTHVMRVSNRVGLSNGKTPVQIEHDLEACIPDKLKYLAHHYLILHGRYTCIARKPKCEQCVIADYCNYFQAQNK